MTINNIIYIYIHIHLSLSIYLSLSLSIYIYLYTLHVLIGTTCEMVALQVLAEVDKLRGPLVVGACGTIIYAYIYIYIYISLSLYIYIYIYINYEFNKCYNILYHISRQTPRPTCRRSLRNQSVSSRHNRGNNKRNTLEEMYMIKCI